MVRKTPRELTPREHRLLLLSVETTLQGANASCAIEGEGIDPMLLPTAESLLIGKTMQELHDMAVNAHIIE